VSPSSSTLCHTALLCPAPASESQHLVRATAAATIDADHIAVALDATRPLPPREAPVNQVWAQLSRARIEGATVRAKLEVGEIPAEGDSVELEANALKRGPKEWPAVGDSVEVVVATAKERSRDSADTGIAFDYVLGAAARPLLVSHASSNADDAPIAVVAPAGPRSALARLMNIDSLASDESAVADTSDAAKPDLQHNSSKEESEPVLQRNATTGVISLNLQRNASAEAPSALSHLFNIHDDAAPSVPLLLVLQRRPRLGVIACVPAPPGFLVPDSLAVRVRAPPTPQWDAPRRTLWAAARSAGVVSVALPPSLEPGEPRLLSRQVGRRRASTRRRTPASTGRSRHCCRARRCCLAESRHARSRTMRVAPRQATWRRLVRTRCCRPGRAGS
jgi:hypothetical protein